MVHWVGRQIISHTRQWVHIRVWSGRIPISERASNRFILLLQLVYVEIFNKNNKLYTNNILYTMTVTSMLHFAQCSV